MHAKTWIFDDTLAVVGSANFNRRSLFVDGEIAAAIRDDAGWAAGLRQWLWVRRLSSDRRTVRPHQVADFTVGLPLWTDTPDTLLRRLDLAADERIHPDRLILCGRAVPSPRDEMLRMLACTVLPVLGIRTHTFDGQWDHVIDPSLSP
ncbi:hypothetical protein GCM10010399_71840 [Dactylosporangium fulvum]|uniref:Phospholipase D-like domain-containing protein n=1 Tax=Dactylosporangium fulvum TaxID=53359 RepID=A0ABY5W6X0_9ACTN|nr:phospholipase D-like domain-containing protein [Dactylosporangium fulvum]UWP85115.1 phospholipase D-like domain-containing protein [Dactylosporangium fulvum]